MVLGENCSLKKLSITSKNKSESPVDALAVKKGEWLTQWQIEIKRC